MKIFINYFSIAIFLISCFEKCRLNCFLKASGFVQTVRCFSIFAKLNAVAAFLLFEMIIEQLLNAVEKTHLSLRFATVIWFSSREATTDQLLT